MPRRIHCAAAAASAPEPPGDKVVQMKSILNDIKAIYDRGTPLFTKDAIRKAGQELEICKTFTSGGRSITLRGINGMDYTNFVKHPSDLPLLKGQSTYVDGETWVICYHSIESLTSETNPDFFCPQRAYLPMEICACTAVIDHSLTPGENDLQLSSNTKQLLEAFHDIRRPWRTSHYYQQLQTALAKVKPPSILDKIIGVALGPFEYEGLVIRRSMLQHILLSAIHSILSEQNILSASCKRYVQDPQYSQQHREVLSLAEFTVLDDPQAFLTLDDSSVLVSINPDVPVGQIVADICCPGVIIWDKKRDHSFPRTDPHSPRVDRFIEQNYYELSFPYHESFGELVMYVKKNT